MNNALFTGVCTALVTPYLGDQINYPMLQQLLRRQLDNDVRDIIICGTTGEAPTLSDEEKLKLFHTAKEFVGNEARIYAGTGSNNTAHAIKLSQQAELIGVDGLLIVSPYYNKSTSEGLYKHYYSISNAVDLPIIIYNVPGRTGVDIPVDVYRRLSSIPNIAGIKEASTDITKTLQIKSACPEAFTVWSGNDDMTVPLMSLGGLGVISVLSNVVPKETQAMAQAALEGDFQTAAALQTKLYPLIRLLFCEVNPIPVKAAMKRIGFDCGECRLPLCPMSDRNYRKLMEFLPY